MKTRIGVLILALVLSGLGPVTALAGPLPGKGAVKLFARAFPEVKTIAVVYSDGDHDAFVNEMWVRHRPTLEARTDGWKQPHDDSAYRTAIEKSQ